jgi:hypothetical protein
MALLLEIAQQEELYFRTERDKEVEFDRTLESEQLLTLTLSRLDASSPITSARLDLEGGGTEEIKVEEAQSLISPQARKEWRQNEIENAAEEDRRQSDSAQSVTAARAIFPVEEKLNTQQIRDAYVPAERGQVSAFRLEEMRHDIVVGLAGAKPDDPIEAAAKRNYYQGQADLYNNIRTGLVKDDPSLEAALPWEIKTEAIQAPEIQEERDKTKERDQSQVVTLG